MNTATADNTYFVAGDGSKPNKSFIILTSGAAALGGLLYGFHTAIISGAIQYISKYFSFDEYMPGWSVSSILISGAVGAMFISNFTFLWLADFAVTYSFPIMKKQLGVSATLFCYPVFCAIAFVYMFFKVKETKGKSLENIETLFIL